MGGKLGEHGRKLTALEGNMEIKDRQYEEKFVQLEKNYEEKLTQLEKTLEKEVKEIKGEGEINIVAEDAREVAEEFKMNWEKKKEEIEKMERIKMDEIRDYQGELKNGKKNGFGIMFWTSG